MSSKFYKTTFECRQRIPGTQKSNPTLRKEVNQLQHAIPVQQRYKTTADHGKYHTPLDTAITTLRIETSKRGRPNTSKPGSPALQADSNGTIHVTRVYVPWFFVSSQQRIGATDIKALGASQLSGLGQTVLQLLG